MSTGLLRVGSTRRSKTKSPYARRPARASGPSARPVQPTQESSQIQHAGSGSQVIYAPTCGLQDTSEVSPVNATPPVNITGDQPQLQQTFSVAASQNIPDVQPLLQDTSMTTATKNVVYQPDSIWIVGSSLIKRAEQFSLSSPEFGTDLSLPGVKVLWKGIPGLSFAKFSEVISDLSSTKPHPRFLVIHVGGNDIAKLNNPLRRQQKFMKTVINKLSLVMPLTCIVWSHILPRVYWRHSISNVAAEKSRSRINSSIASFVLKSGGASIKYPDISIVQSKLFLNDGVHLSPLGNYVFLSTMQAALRQFCSGNGFVYPSK
ncbi:uncharacterized protein LOC133191937 [Saccostrea echinata]|uniref:uncharacterized protein LOC133191937 n=1 Tax=Saccostrea echinata TaxID=191078 RepID=UPI002A82840D|nr:uncharacterized protein LOC133191937 [Saccostrea echinata]